MTGIKAALWGKPTYQDLLGADREAARLREALEHDDLPTAVDAIRQLRGGAWEDRHFLCEVVAHHADPDLLEQLCRVERGDAIPLLLHAAKAIRLAWEARSAADTLTSISWASFKDHLSRAEACLARAAQLDPVDPTPHVYMVTVARGLQVPAAAAAAHFRKAIERDPFHVPAHAAMVELLSPTWGGSREALFDFARTAWRAAPEGKEVRLLPLLAGIEWWHYVHAMEGEPEAAVAWAREPAVRDEVLAGYDASLRSDRHVPGRYTPQRRNEAAFWFHLTGDRPRLRHEMALVGRACTVTPWCYLGEPAEVFAEARKAARA